MRATGGVLTGLTIVAASAAGTVAFLDRSGDVLARASSVQYGAWVGECYPMTYSMLGRLGPPLLAGGFLLRVKRLLR